MKSSNSIKPTVEQKLAIDLFTTGKSLKINAYAGTGKTATLVMLANSTYLQGSYLAFNRSLADDARTKFPITVICRTTHQLAFHDTPEIFRRNRDKMFGSVNANFIASRYLLEKLVINKSFSLSPRQRGAMVLETLRKFMQSADRYISTNHVPVWGKMEELSAPDKKAVMNNAVESSIRLWNSMIDPSDPVPLGHDGYYKLWALSDPVIPGDYILIDESQDTNGAMLGVLKQQCAQMVYVGDRYQQIYEWRGAINAMTIIKTDHNSNLTRSFRFGQAIADAASQILAVLGEKDKIIGNPMINSRMGCQAPNAILCRTNAGVIEHLLKALDAGIKPHVIGGNGEVLRLLKGVAQLKSKLPVDIPEFFGFSDWHEIVEFSETEEGTHLAMLVRLVDRYGEDYLIDVFSDMHQSEHTAELIISTTHRAKGRQWPRILIHDDFPLVYKPSDGPEVFNAAELRLFYVAVTRGQFEVGIPGELAKFFGIHQQNAESSFHEHPVLVS